MGISRIERVETELQRMTRRIIDKNRFSSTGVTTDALASYLRLARVNVSRDLNQLVREKKAVKIKLRPVLYFSATVIEQELSETITNFEVKSFDDLFNSKLAPGKNNEELFPLVGASGSLATMVENAKSAMVYPPHGLHTLLTGETGVGKSLFAEAMYNFGKKFGTLTEDAPLVIFNCADYANNPQLLMSQLFGYTKGAFTGADNDSPGLIDKAENGVLFLDEIHRLPPEGQEMLFQLIDKGVYRKMGTATKPQKANVLIIGATTESDKNLLPTLMRRIPVAINLPSLAERPLTERLQLIEHFFSLESIRIQKRIVVSREIVKDLLTYKCTGNIGQLRSDIQVICAKGLYKSIQKQNNNIEIQLTDLPPLIYTDNFDSSQRREVDKVLGFLDSDSFVFPLPKQHKNILELREQEFDSNALYTKIVNIWNESVKDNLGLTIINNKINQVLQDLTTRSNIDVKLLAEDQLVDAELLRKLKSVMSYYYPNMSATEIKRSCRIIGTHLQHVINQKQSQVPVDISTGTEEMQQSLESLRQSNTIEVQFATKVTDFVNTKYQIQFNYLDFVYIVNYLELIQQTAKAEVGLLVIMHGNSTATSMANFANELLGIHSIESLNMDLDDSIPTVLNSAVKKIKLMAHHCTSVLILADMGSILGFELYLHQQTQIAIHTVDMVSTPILLELAVKSQNHSMNLDNLFEYANQLKGQYYGDAENNRHKVSLSFFEQTLVRNLAEILTFLNPTKAFLIIKPSLQRLCNKYNIPLRDDILVKCVFHIASMLERCILRDYLPYRDAKKSLQEYPQFSKELTHELIMIGQRFGVKVPETEVASVLDIFRADDKSHLI